MAESDIQYGSEEVYAHACDACQDDNILRKAEGYCKNCPEYLCTNCIHLHKSVRLTRSHEIIDVTDDIDDVIGQLADTTIEDDVCLDHGKSPIDKYCKNHDVVGCDMCLTLSHNKCDTEPISRTLLTFNDTMRNNTMTKLRKVISGFTQSRSDNEKAEQNAIKEFKGFLDRQKVQRKHILQQMRMDQIKDEEVKVALLNAFLRNAKLRNKMIVDSIKVADTLQKQSTEVYQSTNDTKKFISWNKLSKQLGLLDKTLSEVNVTDVSIFEGSMEEQAFKLYKNEFGKNPVVIDILNSTNIKAAMSEHHMNIKYDPLCGQDTMVEHGVTTNINTKHQCLTAMKKYEMKSQEEMRYEWYLDFIDSYASSKDGLIPVRDTESFTPAKNKAIFNMSGFRYKMLLLGDWGVGKTTFISRHISGDVSKVYKESLGFNVHPVTLYTTFGQIAFDVWDTCGQERFGPLRDGLFKGVQCAIIMFDVSSTTSIDSVSKWYTVLRDKCGYLPFMVCGNRVDQATATVKATNLDMLRNLKIPCLKYQLMSGKTMNNFESPFLAIARALTSNYTMDIQTKCSLYPPVTSGIETKVPEPEQRFKADDDDDL